MLFLQETNSNSKIEQNWKEDFTGQVFTSHGKTRKVTNPKKQLIIAEDFNLFFDSKLDAQGGNPTIKKKPLAKLIELKENYDSCNIWRVRIRNVSGLVLHKNIPQISFSLDLTTCSF